ncbi:3'-N-debenzoyl-2'-deoxytaxol N-benzoyltransferase [Platanthera guangdongensis]|uniref:3'-N-debenzoyl-2'-deoxytaxol N-benzoyltransferase n=1 Tax=Platanthera guangdongensis TaxID=2320717 RepID=A0ABR2MMN1_9ASPA
MLCPHYIQKGLLLTNLPPNFPTHRVLTLLETSLSDALRHFYPLAGRLQTQSLRNLEGHVTGLEVYIDCNDEGAEFIHAVAENITADDVVSPGNDIPCFVNSFFPLNGAINYDCQSAPLLSLQLTKLADGALFLGCCLNHVVGDGTSYWNFFNGWAEIARTNTLSRTKGFSNLSQDFRRRCFAKVDLRSLLSIFDSVYFNCLPVQQFEDLSKAIVPISRHDTSLINSFVNSLYTATPYDSVALTDAASTADIDVYASSDRLGQHLLEESYTGK